MRKKRVEGWGGLLLNGICRTNTGAQETASLTERRKGEAARLKQEVHISKRCNLVLPLLVTPGLFRHKAKELGSWAALDLPEPDIKRCFAKSTMKQLGPTPCLDSTLQLLD